jgi:ribosomal protein S18 acetylase RimI-like enzyme
MKIRKATIKDLDEITRLSIEYDEYEYKLNKKVKVDSFNEVKRVTKEHLANPKFIFFVAELDNKIVGWIAIDVRCVGNKKQGVFHTIRVTKSARGKNIGTLLLNKAMNHFKEKKCSSVRSFVHLNNKKALNWYKRLGFEAEGGYTITKKLK